MTLGPTTPPTLPISTRLGHLCPYRQHGAPAHSQHVSDSLPDPNDVPPSLKLSPHTLFPLDPDDLPPLTPVPPTSPPHPPPPPTFAFSSTHNYPAPHGFMSLGSTFSSHVRLVNTRADGGEVLGVKMMLEFQGPGGRYRLGEAIHGDESASVASGELPALRKGGGVELEVEAEMKELGLHVLICSVAWETLDGRKTFQRFFKFNVGRTPHGS